MKSKSAGLNETIIGISKARGEMAAIPLSTVANDVERTAGYSTEL